MFGAHVTQKREEDPHAMGNTGSSESHCWRWDLNQEHMGEKLVLLTAESSMQYSPNSIEIK